MFGDSLDRLKQGGRDRSDYFRFSDSDDNLILEAEHLARSQALIGQAMEDYAENILYDAQYNRWVHQVNGLYDIDPDTGIATNCAARVTHHYRHFHVDLSDAGDVKCCTPNIACQSCRLYAQSLGSALQRQTRSSRRGQDFEQWLQLWKLWHQLFWGDLPERFADSETLSQRFIPLQDLSAVPAL